MRALFSTAWPQVPIISPVSKGYNGRADHHGYSLNLPPLGQRSITSSELC